MATYNLNQSDFTNTLTANFDAATRQDILNYLNTQGIYGPGGSTNAQVQYQPTPPGGASVPPIEAGAQISEFTPTLFSIDTGSNANIKAVIATSLNVTVNIAAGNESILLASGNGNDALTDSTNNNDAKLCRCGPSFRMRA
jgi:hypothetical protein